MYKLRSTQIFGEGTRITIQTDFNEDINRNITRTLRQYDLDSSNLLKEGNGKLKNGDVNTHDINIYNFTSISTLIYVTNEPILEGRSVVRKYYYYAIKYFNSEEKLSILDFFNNELHFQENTDNDEEEEENPFSVEIVDNIENSEEPIITQIGVDEEARSIVNTERTRSYVTNGADVYDYNSFLEELDDIALNLNFDWIEDNITSLRDLRRISKPCSFKEFQDEDTPLNVKLGAYFELQGFPFIVYFRCNSNNTTGRKTIYLYHLDFDYLGDNSCSSVLKPVICNKFKEKFNVRILSEQQELQYLDIFELYSDLQNIYLGSNLLYDRVGLSKTQNLDNNFGSTRTLETVLIDIGTSIPYKFYKDNVLEDGSNTVTGNFLNHLNKVRIYKKKYLSITDNTTHILVFDETSDIYRYFNFNSEGKLIKMLIFYEFPEAFLLYNNLFLEKSFDDMESYREFYRDNISSIHRIAIDSIFAHFGKLY